MQGSFNLAGLHCVGQHSVTSGLLQSSVFESMHAVQYSIITYNKLSSSNLETRRQMLPLFFASLPFSVEL